MPDHPFEQLGPERFQQLCQALLSSLFPLTQCLPVGQPDGGRDAFLRSLDGGESLVFQAKFSRQPGWLQNPEDWVSKLLGAERPKLDILKSRGATRYLLLTNLSASAHLQKGALDRVQAVLDTLPLPASCWWRDDLNRRLENEYDLKLSYPELFTGADFLRVLIQQGLDAEDAKRRRHALRAYLATQYSHECEVKFKQAELNNGDLLSVFVDVPVDINREQLLEKPTALGEVLTRKATAPRAVSSTTPAQPDEAQCLGAGTLLLDQEFAQAAPRSVVEGAPGQGKSTVLQYVCQVHRMRILDKEDLLQVPLAHAASLVRLPFRVDLRELAQWLLGTNPYENRGEEIPSSQRTLEGFLADSVQRASGGANFSVSDLQAAIVQSHVMLALDGLDEVADPDDRAAVVEAIEDGVERVEAIARSLLTIVTSRPASFAGTIGLPRGQFQVVRLDSLTRPLIREYSDRWMSARELEKHERQELISTLNAKLDQAHIRDLAHNPMQLAILLNLIHRRGPALPDQRTALYSSYMEQFLDREAEKSRAVRDHRELLTTLHGHIAWLLHCRAERSADSGRFSTDEVKAIAGDFLEQKGYPRNLFGDLFTGALDRVGALVSRTQGTYEFEVQPLREFFAAQFLYQTAPYSAPGQAQSGTRPERLDALARHPYWLNVTRFYAGAYDVGEIASLADHLETLHAELPWRNTDHPRAVAARLLADWAFQQDRKVQERITAMLKRDILSRGSATRRYGPYEGDAQLPIPADCGGAELLEYVLNTLGSDMSADRWHALVSIVVSQVQGSDERKRLWDAILKSLKGQQKNQWIRASFQLGLYQQPLNCLSAAEIPSDDTIAAILYAEQFAAFDDSGNLRRRATNIVLQTPNVANPASDTNHPLAALACALLMDRTQRPNGGDRALSLLELAVERGHPAYTTVNQFLETSLAGVMDERINWKMDLKPWMELVETGRSLFGDKDALLDLAIIAAGVSDQPAYDSAAPGLFDPTGAACTRTQQARARAADGRWWKTTLQECSTEADCVMAAALAVTWATSEVLEEIAVALGALLEQLSTDGKERLLRVLGRAQSVGATDLQSVSWPGAAAPPVSPTLFAAMIGRLEASEAERIYDKHRWFTAVGGTPAVLDVLFSQELGLAEGDPNRWDEIAAAACRHYAAVGWEAARLFFPIDDRPTVLPTAVAESILRAPEDFPLALVSLAESRLLSDAQASVKSVADVAAADGWFE